MRERAQFPYLLLQKVSCSHKVFYCKFLTNKTKIKKEVFSPVCKTVPYGLMAALSRLIVSLYEIMSRIWFFWEPNTALWLPWAPGTWHSLLWTVFLNIFHSYLLPRCGHSWQCHPCQRVIQASLHVSPNIRFSLSGQPLTLHPKSWVKKMP